jgi:hypothetical protein
MILKFPRTSNLKYRLSFLLSSEAELSLKENLGKTFLEVASKVLPGISRLKACRITTFA